MSRDSRFLYSCCHIWFDTYVRHFMKLLSHYIFENKVLIPCTYLFNALILHIVHVGSWEDWGCFKDRVSNISKKRRLVHPHSNYHHYVVSMFFLHVRLLWAVTQDYCIHVLNRLLETYGRHFMKWVLHYVFEEKILIFC